MGIFIFLEAEHYHPDAQLLALVLQEGLLVV